LAKPSTRSSVLTTVLLPRRLAGCANCTATLIRALFTRA